MKLNLKILAPAVLVLAIIVVFIMSWSSSIPEEEATPESIAVILPEAKGDIDSTANDLIATAENEAEILKNESIDLDLVDSELKIIDDFGNTHNYE